MSRRMKLGIAVVILLILLAATAPSEASFKAKLETDAREHATGFFDRVLNDISTAFLTNNVRYHNYVFFAVAETRIGSLRVKYVGLIGNWFQVG